MDCLLPGSLLSTCFQYVFSKHTGNFSKYSLKKSSVPILQGPNCGHVTPDIEKACNTVFASNFNHIGIEHSNQADHILLPATEFPEELLCTEEHISSLSVSKSTGADGISA